MGPDPDPPHLHLGPLPDLRLPLPRRVGVVLLADLGDLADVRGLPGGGLRRLAGGGGPGEGKGVRESQEG